VPIFSRKGQRSKVKVTVRQKQHKILTYGWPIKRRRIRRRLQTRPTLLLGLIYCRRLNMSRSATGRTAAYHVGTRRRHAFLFYTGRSIFSFFSFFRLIIWLPYSFLIANVNVLLIVFGIHVSIEIYIINILYMTLVAGLYACVSAGLRLRVLVARMGQKRSGTHHTG